WLRHRCRQLQYHPWPEPRRARKYRLPPALRLDFLRRVPPLAQLPHLHQQQHQQPDQPGDGYTFLAMHAPAHLRLVLCLLLAGSALAAAQQAALKAHVEITRNGHKQKDASKAVVWLTPVGGGPVDYPRQQPGEIPKLVQKDKSFHPSLVV